MNASIEKIQAGQNLTSLEIEEAMRFIISGQAQEAQIKDFLLALNTKGPTVEEITGAAKIMRQFALPIKASAKVILDTCGTGGDKKGTFNISTLVALTVASLGVTVAKHGNRSVSSKCGSADILEALGVNLELEEKRLSECLNQVGIAFLFAQKMHPAMKNVAPARQALGVRTIFNILGPLTNPANATHQIMGVYGRDLLEPMAHVLKNLGLKKALVVHGADGLDELTTTTKSYVSEFDGREIVSYDIDPQELGFSLGRASDLKGGDLKTNVRIAQDVLKGRKGPQQDIVVLNAAYALYVAERVPNVREGIEAAQEALASGRSAKKLQQLIEFTRD